MKNKGGGEARERRKNIDAYLIEINKRN